MRKLIPNDCPACKERGEDKPGLHLDMKKYGHNLLMSCTVCGWKATYPV